MKKEPKILTTAQLKFPFEIYAFMGFIVFLCFIVGKEILVGDGYNLIETILLLTMIISAFTLIIFMGRRYYIRLVIYSDKLVIRPVFSLKPTLIDKHQLKGFELFETAVRGGIGYNIRLITNANKKIVLPRDNYNNYEKILTALHKSEFTYLGQKDMNRTFAEVYGKILLWTTFVFPIVYGLFLLIKTMKLVR